MSSRYVEKAFLYLILASLLLHVALGTALYLMPKEKTKPAEETTMVELKDLPEPPPPLPQKAEPKPPVKRLPTRRTPIARAPTLPPERVLPQARREAAPKAENKPERIVQSKNVPNLPARVEQKPQPPKADSGLTTPEAPGNTATRGEGFFKPHKGARTDLARLFPSASKMNSIEESFRKKYLETERGDTRLMDTDDPDIGSFTRRYVMALTERLNVIDTHERKGLGTTVLKVTIKRDGSVGGITVLYSTGNRALDDLAIQASRTASYVGPLPRRWAYDVLNMICSFTIREGFVATRWESY